MALIDNLTAYYSCEENAANTTVVDSHGTFTGTSSTNTNNLSAIGKVNNGFNVLTTETINLGISTGIYFAGEITVGAWVKSTNNGWVVEKKITAAGHYNYLLRIEADKAGFFNDRTAGTRFVDGTSNIRDGNWHLIIGRGNSAGMDIYVDNILEAHTVNANAPMPITETNAAILGGLAVVYAGDFDEVGLWGRALTDGSPGVGNAATGEIAELWNGGDGLAYPFAVVTNMQINIADVWKDVNSIQINVGDVWKDVAGVQINIGDVWKDVF